MTLPRFSEHLLLRTALTGCLQVNISSSLWLISYTQSFKELSWVFLNSRLHSEAAIERRIIVYWEIAISKKSYRIETSQCKCKSIDRFLYNTNSFFVSSLLVNNKNIVGTASSLIILLFFTFNNSAYKKENAIRWILRK